MEKWWQPVRGQAADLEERLSSERFLDPHREVRRRLGLTFGANDHLQGPGEFGPVQAGGALGEVPSEVGSLGRIELTVQEVLDLLKNFFATNL